MQADQDQIRHDAHISQASSKDKFVTVHTTFQACLTAERDPHLLERRVARHMPVFLLFILESLAVQIPRISLMAASSCLHFFSAPRSPWSLTFNLTLLPLAFCIRRTSFACFRSTSLAAVVFFLNRSVSSRTSWSSLSRASLSFLNPSLVFFNSAADWGVAP